MDPLSIILGECNDERGLTLLDAVLKLPDGAELDARTEAAVEAGRACRRFRHLEFKQQHGGWARGESRRVDVSAQAMCFRFAEPIAGPAYVTIEYLDRGVRPFSVGRPATSLGAGGGAEAAGALLGTEQWQSLTLRVEAPREPAPYDLRIACAEPMWIAGVAVSAQEPADFVEPHALILERAKAALGPAAGEAPAIAVAVGNIGSILPAHDQGDLGWMPPWLPIFKGLGVTSVQSYVKWSQIEPEPGAFDWSFYDRAVELAQANGLKWVMFVPLGPSYTVPEWFKQSEKSVFVKCLEHGTECPVQSIWNPHLLEYVDRFFALLAERYGGRGVVESIMTGPSGDFGETTFNAVYIVKEGYHTHLGYWCGDDHARADLRRHLQAQYGTLRALNAAWGARFARWSQIEPFMPADAPGRRAEMDFRTWYVGSMTAWSEKWAAVVHQHFPEAPIYHAAGGSGDPIHGGDWADQARVGAPHRTGLRVTNEGTPYAFNFIYTRWAATACKHYGAPFGNEPWGGDMSGIGNVGRIYNAATTQADQFWIYAGHVTTADYIEAFRQSRRFLRGEEVIVDVAAYYPKLHFALTDEHGFAEGKPRSLWWAQGEELRDLADFDIVDATLIADGALRRRRFLILLQGNTMERAALEAIEAWVEGGGVLIGHEFGPIEDEEGRDWRSRLFGGGDEVMENCRVRPMGRGTAALFPGCADLQGAEGDHKDHPATRPAFLAMVAAILRHPERLQPGLEPRLDPDGEMDGVFAARTHEGILYLNTNQEPVEKRIFGLDGERSVVVPGFSIFRVRL
jgi:hypothetical protein